MRVPYDEIAEEEVVGVVVGSRHGAGLILGRGITAEDFYKPDHARLFAAVASSEALPNVVDDLERARIAATAAEVDEDVAAQLVMGRCVGWDEAGTFSRRVKAAARNRAAMQVFADAYNAIGEGFGLEDVAEFVVAVL